MSDKGFFRLSLIISLVVFVAVVVLNRRVLPVPDEIPSFVYQLPSINATINALCFVLLLASFRAIKQKKIQLHKNINLITFVLSAVFLVGYVLYHYFVEHTPYGGEGFVKTFYLVLLFTHIVAAAVVLPLILLALYHGLKGQVEKHKKTVRFTYPIWLFVTLSGVIIYLMIKPYYNFPI